MFGDYQYTIGPFTTAELGNPYDDYLCTDEHSTRKVAGYIAYYNGGYKCMVEWNARLSANNSFYVLQKGDYEWSPITDNNRTSEKNYILANGITNGGIDLGEYVFHCKIQSLST